MDMLEATLSGNGIFILLTKAESVVSKYGWSQSYGFVKDEEVFKRLSMVTVPRVPMLTMVTVPGPHAHPGNSTWFPCSPGNCTWSHALHGNSTWYPCSPW